MTRHLTDEEIKGYRAGTPMFSAVRNEENHLQACPACRKRLERTDARALELAARATFFPRDGSIWHPTLAQAVAYALGEADEFDREIIEGHLEDCLACQADLRDVHEFRESQSHLPPCFYAPERAVSD